MRLVRKKPLLAEFKDLDAEKGIHMWVVSDNLLKGAAWNSVQIAETLHERGLVRPTAEVVFELK